jgi:CRP/FNR family transcriptional regulator, cyclic AMP receptor protein
MRKALYILGSLDDADVEWIARSGTKLSLRPGEILVHEGKPIEYLYILIAGQLGVRIGKNADKQIAVLLPGEIVGEISFVDNRNPTASVVALQESRMLALSRSELTVRLARDQGFAARFYRAIATFLADRLFATTLRLGYGTPDQDRDVDIIEDSLMDEVSLASIRFDKLLRHLADNQSVGSFAGVKL